jgi:hypothetical protein
VFSLTVLNLLIGFANIYQILDGQVTGSWFNNHQPLTSRVSPFCDAINACDSMGGVMVLTCM